VLNNFDDRNGAIAAARIFLAITMFFTFPLELFVCRDTLREAIGVWHPHLGSRLPGSWHIVTTCALVAAATAISMATDNLGVVLELTGGMSAVVLGFVMPGAVHLYCAGGPWRSWFRMDTAPSVLLVGVGTFVAIASTAITISRIATGSQRG
jgi:sodium-coupled neutral amino acid transporter 11